MRASEKVKKTVPSASLLKSNLASIFADSFEVTQDRTDASRSAGTCIMDKWDISLVLDDVAQGPVPEDEGDKDSMLSIKARTDESASSDIPIYCGTQRTWRR